MRYTISRIFGVLVGTPIAIISCIVSIFVLDISFLLDALIGLSMFFVSYLPTQRLTSRKYLIDIGLSRRDYRFVRQQLSISHKKIRSIIKSFINIRSIQDFRQINDIYRIAKSIHFSVKQRPRMFFKVESLFLFTHRQRFKSCGIL